MVKNILYILNGFEEWKHIYASVMIFDENNTDLLYSESPEKERLINYFSNLIKKHKTEKKDFYKAYQKTENSKSREK